MEMGRRKYTNALPGAGCVTISKLDTFVAFAAQPAVTNDTTIKNTKPKIFNLFIIVPVRNTTFCDLKPEPRHEVYDIAYGASAGD